MSGNGLITNPFDLATALTGAIARPGDTLILRGGTYSGNFVSQLIGKTGQPITLRNYPGERPIIDGGLTFSASHYTRWMGIEFAGSAFEDRSTSDDGITKIVLVGDGHQFINCIIHNGNQGISGGDASLEYEVYGCLIYHNGYDSDLGHGVYCQHSNTVGKAIFENNILFDNFAYGFHLYGNPRLINFELRKNISFNNGSPRNTPARNLLGGYGGVFNPIVADNVFYHQLEGAENFRLGWGTGNEVTGAVVTGNISANAQTGMCFVDAVSPTITGNYAYGNFLKLVGGTQTDAKGDYPNNTFGESSAWADQVIVNPNKYQLDRAHVAILNKIQADTVAVDLTAVTGLSAGDSVTVRNVQDYFADIQTLTLDANKCITVNMQAENRTVSVPVGWDAPATTFPTFGCFVVEKA